MGNGTDVSYVLQLLLVIKWRSPLHEKEVMDVCACVRVYVCTCVISTYVFVYVFTFDVRFLVRKITRQGLHRMT